MMITPENVQAMHVQATAYRLAAELAASLPAQAGPTVTTYETIYTYDDNGNQTSRVTKTNGTPGVTNGYVYDVQNRLIELAKDSGSGPVTDTTYAYDADGIRRGKTDSDVTIYVTDKNRDYAQVLVELTDVGGANEEIVHYVHGDDLISQRRDGVTHYYHYDGQMSTRMLTDDPADPANDPAIVTDSYTYDAFGNLLGSWYSSTQSEATPNDYRYTGEQYDPNTGYYYLRARYMDPVTGRFVTRDPFAGVSADPVTLHKYLYAGANPVMNIDPSGLFLGSLSGQLAVTGICGILGAALGYAVSGTAWGAVYGTAIFMGLTSSIVIFRDGSMALKMVLGGVLAGLIGMLDHWSKVQARFEKQGNYREIFLRGFASVVSLSIVGKLLGDWLEKKLANRLGDYELAMDLLTTAFLELGLAVTTGDLWANPWRIFANILIEAGITVVKHFFSKHTGAEITAAQARSLVQNLHDATFGFMAARVNDIAWKVKEYFFS